MIRTPEMKQILGYHGLFTHLVTAEIRYHGEQFSSRYQELAPKNGDLLTQGQLGDGCKLHVGRAFVNFADL